MTDIRHAHLYGTRESKYEWLNAHDVLSTDWNEISPQSPFYLLIPQNTDLLSEYQEGWKLTEVMPVNSVGIVTARDSLTIHWTREEVWETVKDFVSLDPEIAREKYDLGSDAKDWKISLAQNDLRVSGISQEMLVPILYRPFDIRYTYYTGTSRGFHCRPRNEVMRHLMFDNVGLVCKRQSLNPAVNNYFSCSANLVGDGYFAADNKGRDSIFPLYLYSDRTEITQQHRPNFSSEFLKDITGKLGYTPTPETIFYYIYAVFNSPTYRTRYAEFLKLDFPRVPLTRNDELFRGLASYGEELVALHLMKSPKLDNFITQFIESGGNCVVDAGHPKYSSGDVVINKKGDSFAGVPESVWNFYVGGYQVCNKWLKDRKGRTLSPEDIQHYQKIVVALHETIALITKIDAAIPSFPIE
jgi:predicted helicase